MYASRRPTQMSASGSFGRAAASTRARPSCSIIRALVAESNRGRRSVSPSREMPCTSVTRGSCAAIAGAASANATAVARKRDALVIPNCVLQVPPEEEQRHACAEEVGNPSLLLESVGAKDGQRLPDVRIGRKLRRQE